MHKLVLDLLDVCDSDTQIVFRFNTCNKVKLHYNYIANLYKYTYIC